MKAIFIVLCVFIVSLFFREQRIPSGWAEWFADRNVPTNLVLKVDSVAFGFRKGLRLGGVRLYDTSAADPTRLLAGADVIAFNPIRRKLYVEGATYERLPDGYYAPGNQEKNARVECEFPAWGAFNVELVRPNILAIQPECLTFVVEINRHRIDFQHMHLVWPKAKGREEPQSVDGFCYVDLDKQEVYGSIEGHATQAQIRPMLVAIDVPVALPYMDGFTEVPVPCKSKCTWQVDLVRNDLDLWLDLHPILGCYNAVPMQKADGTIHLHNYTRGTCLNYKTTVGPISAVDVDGRKLDGTVTIVGTNGYNVVDVHATSSQPIADVLKIGGFAGDYVGREVFGDSKCDLQFRFPRAMTNNYEVMDGFGHVSVRNGQLMRMKGFKGLIEAMPKIAPAVTWLSDSTQASGDYVISNGVLKTDNIYIEGSVFSIKMFGWLDTVRNEQDFTVRVQFAKSDSMIGKILHPLAWPFTKLLLEFRLTGTPEEPKWKYISVINRVVEAVK